MKEFSCSVLCVGSEMEFWMELVMGFGICGGRGRWSAFLDPPPPPAGWVVWELGRPEMASMEEGVVVSWLTGAGLRLGVTR